MPAGWFSSAAFVEGAFSVPSYTPNRRVVFGRIPAPVVYVVQGLCVRRFGSGSGGGGGGRCRILPSHRAAKVERDDSVEAAIPAENDGAVAMFLLGGSEIF